MKSCTGCRITSRLSLIKRLKPLLGQPVRVLTLAETFSGLVNEVSQKFLQVGETRIPLVSPIAIDVGFFEAECTFKRLDEQIPVIVRIKELGTFQGCLVSFTKQFVEFEQELPEDIARWIVPLGRTVLVRCEEENEE